MRPLIARRLWLRALAAGAAVSLFGWLLAPFGVLSTPGVLLAWMTVPHPAVVLAGSLLAWTLLFVGIGIVAARRQPAAREP